MSDPLMNRRQALGATAAGITLASLTPPASAAGDTPRLKKAVKIGMVSREAKNLSLADKFELLKRLGYDGIELDSPNRLDAKEVLAAIDKTGLPVHGVVDSVHWKQTLSDPDRDHAAVIEAGTSSARHLLTSD